VPPQCFAVAAFATRIDEVGPLLQVRFGFAILAMWPFIATNLINKRLTLARDRALVFTSTVRRLGILLSTARTRYLSDVIIQSPTSVRPERAV
jgi:hypothetical protein